MGDIWEMCEPMPTGRSLLALVASHEHIYAIGGLANLITVATVERYNPRTNVWTEVSSMSLPRAAAAAAVLNQYIYVVGGTTKCNSGDTASVERFDQETGKWATVRSSRS